MKFAYSARTKKGEVKSGIVEASDKEAAFEILKRHGLYVTTLDELKIPFYARRLRIFERVGSKDIVYFSRQLAIMLKSNVPLVETFRTLASQTKNTSFKEKILKLAEEIEGGTSLSKALSLYPKIFSPFYISMVKSGEVSGKLTDVFLYLADYLEKEHNFRSKVIGAMIYPLFVLFVFVIVVTIMVVYVIPQLGMVLKETGQDLPFITEMVMSVSDFLRTSLSKLISANFIKSSISEIKDLVGESKVICALSGGVDSSVAAILMSEAIGDNLICIHIDSGMMRKNESNDIIEMFDESYNLNLIHVDASEQFLTKLEGVTDPEKKRKIIGNTFIEVFEEESKKLGDVGYLVQGTLYPDVIESVPVKGQSATIKTHHNVGGLPEKMKLKLIEPFRELFKDEVRSIGRELGLPVEFIERHPFPGPGLAVRIIGDITDDKLEMLREADQIFIDELRNFNIYNDIWQAFAVLLPVQTVGVMGDARTYENVLALRAVTSVDGMTADWYAFQPEVLETVSNKIIRNVSGINRVVYDISSKPPSTIEWE